MKESAYKILTFPGSELPASYKGMVISRWSRSLKYGNDTFKLVDPKAYWAVYPKLIEFLLTRPNTSVRIAVLADDEDVALGFSVQEADALHYVHVDAAQRRQGIGRALSGEAPAKQATTITHVTRLGAPFWTAVLPKAVFNPFRT